ncbi:cAMP-specific 3',5'-cyclic phosphodiesterase [Hondaea fermentalgiana]|uniref:Phosphodiesterase n=1 Tax=Hondaea fermentalgiana TaxID=2315210 RepID=A0A2R5GDV3_9STRA|nr:cAMP-specific 3',5'-cyclic phosphodiesterase [Hondaea fermentalgiana]|eukprot:GBG29112.1 cAMP-specific 3',5'-cyclic phosphodiesterase [Hondaea fermentalgiana]
MLSTSSASSNEKFNNFPDLEDIRDASQEESTQDAQFSSGPLLRGGDVRNRYSMRAGFRTNFARVTPHSSAHRDTDLSSFGGRLTSLSFRRGPLGPLSSQGGNMHMFKRRTLASPILDAVGIAPFANPSAEQKFYKLQCKASLQGLSRAAIGLSFFDATLLSLSMAIWFGPSSYNVCRIIGATISISTKLVFFALFRARPPLASRHLKLIILVITALEVGFTFLIDPVHSVELVSSESMTSLCERGQVTSPYCNYGQNSNGLFLFAVLIALLGLNISHTSTVAAGLSVPLATILASVLLYVSNTSNLVTTCMLFAFGIVCWFGTAQSEARFRQLFDRTVLSQEAMRRNRKLRASFDRHVDNERNLLEHTQLLSQENRILRRKAASRTDAEAANGIELESPLFVAIHDLRDVQRHAKQANEIAMANVLEHVIRSLQSTPELSNIDITRKARQADSLDVKTKEWLSSATSGWEQQRTRNRKVNLKSSDLQPRGDRKSKKASLESLHSSKFLRALTADSDIVHEEESSSSGSNESLVHKDSQTSFDGPAKGPGHENHHRDAGGELSLAPTSASEIAKAQASVPDLLDPITALDVNNAQHEQSLLATLRHTSSTRFQYNHAQQQSTRPTNAMNQDEAPLGRRRSKMPPRQISSANIESIAAMLKDFTSWNEFDVFQLGKLTPFPLTTVVDYAVDLDGTLTAVDISYSRLINFCQFIDTTYCYGQDIMQSEEELMRHRNPYHNNMHAADVVQSTYCFLAHAEEFGNVAPVDRFACVMAAAMHDYHHPGRTNQFLVSQGHPIAIQHNDQSPNERFHLAEAFRAMQEDKHNFLLRLPQKLRLEVRQTIIDLVLATDLAQTMHYLSRFQLYMSARTEASFSGQTNKRLTSLPTVSEEAEALPTSPGSAPSVDSLQQSGSSSLIDTDQSILLMQIAIKVADIGHPCKPRSLHIEWTTRIQQEFFIQGDIQKASGIMVDPLCDRDNINMNKAQCGFIDFVCRPLVQPFAEFANLPSLLENLNSNYRYWTQLEEEESQAVASDSTAEK